MAFTAPDVGTTGLATTLVFGGTSLDPALSTDGTFATRVTSIDWSGIEAASLETSHLGTTVARTFMNGDLYDPGELTMELQFNPDADIFAAFAESQGNVVLTFKNTGGSAAAKWTAAGGLLTGFTVNVATEELMTATATIKLSGAVTVVAETV